MIKSIEMNNPIEIVGKRLGTGEGKMRILYFCRLYIKRYMFLGEEPENLKFCSLDIEGKV